MPSISASDQAWPPPKTSAMELACHVCISVPTTYPRPHPHLLSKIVASSSTRQDGHRQPCVPASSGEISPKGHQRQLGGRRLDDEHLAGIASRRAAGRQGPVLAYFVPTEWKLACGAVFTAPSSPGISSPERDPSFRSPSSLPAFSVDGEYAQHQRQG